MIHLEIRAGTMELAILKDIVIIFALSTVVNLIFTRLKIPTIVGYLITGIIAGPHLLSLVEARQNIELIAKIGVVLLLFTIGLEFSLTHLMRIRRIVFVGGLVQVLVTAGVFYPDISYLRYSVAGSTPYRIPCSFEQFGSGIEAALAENPPSG
jgi:CPA2 family monovalent cation:H+ antiporter-2